MERHEPDRLLPVVVRAFALRANPKPYTARIGKPRATRRRRYPHESLIFDIETSGANGRLDFGVWQLTRDPVNAPAGTTCFEEGIFFADDLPERDPEGFAALQRFVQDYPADVADGFPRHLRLRSQSEWLEERLYRYGYRHRNRCAIVGFNLVHDLGALAAHYGSGRSRFRGAWSLGLWGAAGPDGKWQDRRYRPRLLMKAIDGRRTIFAWGSLSEADQDELIGGGRFVDLRTLTSALTDESYDLERDCAAFGDPYVKANVT